MLTLDDYWKMIEELSKTAASPKMQKHYEMMIKHHNEIKRGGITPQRIREMAYEAIPETK